MWYARFFRCYVNKQISVSELTWHIKPTNLEQAFQQAPHTTQHSTAAALAANQGAHRDIIPSDHLPTKWSFPFSFLIVRMKTIYFSGICFCSHCLHAKIAWSEVGMNKMPAFLSRFCCWQAVWNSVFYFSLVIYVVSSTILAGVSRNSSYNKGLIIWINCYSPSRKCCLYPAFLWQVQ